MDFRFYIPIGIIVIFGLLFFDFISSKRKREKIAVEFGSVPENEIEFESLEFMWEEKKKNMDVGEYIDEATWNDLDMDSVFSRINNCQTSIGEEYLYSRLHELDFNREGFKERERLIETFDSDHALRLNLQELLSNAGKASFNNLRDYCYNLESEQLKPVFLYNILAFLPILLLGLLVFMPGAMLIPFLLSYAVNCIIYLFANKKLQKKIYTINYFSSLLWSAGKICKKMNGSDNVIIKNLEESYRLFGKTVSKLSSVMQQRLSDIEAIMLYFRMMMLSNVRRYNSVIKSLRNNKAAFEQLLDSLGEIDASIAILSYRKSLMYFTHPEFRDEQSFVLSEMYHPLLNNPVPNSVEIEKNCLITGSNASGKSTFIKMFGINLILAQTINTCSAKSFVMKPSFVITSMAVRDNILSGESYYITEVKSLKRILDKVQDVYCVCIVDEILRGTNTIERIAASYSVLKHIETLDCLCMVATHDIELTKLLSDCYENFHFSEKISENEITFDYIINCGPTHTKNAIKLLSFLGFKKEIITDAENAVKKIESGSKD